MVADLERVDDSLPQGGGISSLPFSNDRGYDFRRFGAVSLSRLSSRVTVVDVLVAIPFKDSC